MFKVSIQWFFWFFVASDFAKTIGYIPVSVNTTCYYFFFTRWTNNGNGIVEEKSRTIGKGFIKKPLDPEKKSG